MNFPKIYVLRSLTMNFCRRYSQEIKKRTIESANLSLIRNIGILAHIDAGKTTTVERMLYYSGTIGQMGEVHHGNTVTDFMDQERQRGITITSASITFRWGSHQINLLDTPGHIDFTMEVEQTLNVMDGAVVILDGSAGVEAQTVTVWKQADKYDIPRIVYINKMDKPGAGFFESIDSIQKHLHIVPVTIHLPIISQNKLEGLVDLLSLEKCRWNASALGLDYTRKTLSAEDGELWENAINARMRLTETLADLDDNLAEIIITGREEPETLSAGSLRESLRKITLERKGAVVLCGSSYRNIGVQLLMDGVVNYLPTPLSGQSRKIIDCFGDTLCARAFKVRHDSLKGPITFFRIYSGNLSKGQKIHNIKKEKAEQCGRLYVAYADDYKEVPGIGAGSIVAVTGLKVSFCREQSRQKIEQRKALIPIGALVGVLKTFYKKADWFRCFYWQLTNTGDLVTSSPPIYHLVQTAMRNLECTFSSGTFIPEPVFFCSIEAPSQRYQGALDKALRELEREDPSLRVEVNSDTGQTVLGGMGELHLEVVRERIRSEYKVDAHLGSLQIAYKEALVEDAKGSHSFQNSIGSSFQSVSLDMSVLKGKEKESGKLLLDKSPECIDNISAIFPKHLVAIKNGIESALGCGPKLSCPVINVNVMLHKLEVGRGTSESIVSSASCQCVRKVRFAKAFLGAMGFFPCSWTEPGDGVTVESVHQEPARPRLEEHQRLVKDLKQSTSKDDQSWRCLLVAGFHPVTSPLELSSRWLLQLLNTGGTKLLEPVMLIEVVCNERTISLVMNDLARRRAKLESSDSRALDVVIRALVPLSELLGYSKELRILTSGTTTFSMEFHSLREMSSDEEAKAIRSVIGFGC